MRLSFRTGMACRVHPSLLVLILGLYALVAGPVQPADADVAPAAPLSPDDLVGPVTLQAVDRAAFLAAIEQFSGRTVLPAANLPDTTFSLRVERATPRTRILLALETLANLQGIALADLGDDMMKAVPVATMRAASPDVIRDSLLGVTPSERVVTKLFRLRFQRVSEVLPQLVPLLNPAFGGAIVFEQANAGLITDSVITLQKVEQLLDDLDSPSADELAPKFYTLRYAKAPDIANQLRSVLQGQTRFRLGAGTNFDADERTNQIVLLTDPRLHPVFDRLIAQLDIAAEPLTDTTVIPLRHASAPDVATLLAQLISGQTEQTKKTDRLVTAPTSPSPLSLPAPSDLPKTDTQNAGSETAVMAPASTGTAQNLFATTGGVTPAIVKFSPLLTVVPEPRGNALVVSGTRDDLRLVRKIVDQVDVALAQVRIEVVIAEVNLTRNSASGIESLGLQVQGDKLVGFTAAIPGLSITNGVITRRDGPPAGQDLAATLALTASNTNSRVNVLSVPTLVTTHNKEASIFVGESRPIVSSFYNDGSLSANPQNGNLVTPYRASVTSKDIGLELRVKPLIGSDDSVQLSIKQKVEDILGIILIDGNEQPRVGRRETDSFVSLRSGEIVVLGGLQRSSSDQQASRLGPVPLLGDLLGRRRKDATRTDLIFFLRLTVLGRDVAESANALRRLQEIPIDDAVRRTLSLPPTAGEEPAPAPQTPTGGRRRPR